MSQFLVRKTVTTRFELRVVAVSQTEEFEDGKGHTEGLVADGGRLATASDLVAALRDDAAMADLVLGALVPNSLLQGLAGNQALNEAYCQQLPPGFGMVGRNCKEGGQ